MSDNNVKIELKDGTVITVGSAGGDLKEKAKSFLSIWHYIIIFSGTISGYLAHKAGVIEKAIQMVVGSN